MPDLWQQSEYYCEVWTESRSIAGVIEGDCEELAVSLYPAGGFSSITLAYQSAETINYYADGRPVVFFFISDYIYPAGVLIDVAIERELRKHLSAEIELRFERLAITEDQINQYDLPTKPRKETDRRSLNIRETVEAEAMPAGTSSFFARENRAAFAAPCSCGRTGRGSVGPRVFRAIRRDTRSQSRGAHHDCRAARHLTVLTTKGPLATKRTVAGP